MIENRKCKKCKKNLPKRTKSKYCENCMNGLAQRVKEVGMAAAGVGIFLVAAIFKGKTHPKIK